MQALRKAPTFQRTQSVVAWQSPPRFHLWTWNPDDQSGQAISAKGGTASARSLRKCERNRKRHLHGEGFAVLHGGPEYPQPDGFDRLGVETELRIERADNGHISHVAVSEDDRLHQDLALDLCLLCLGRVVRLHLFQKDGGRDTLAGSVEDGCRLRLDNRERRHDKR